MMCRINGLGNRRRRVHGLSRCEENHMSLVTSIDMVRSVIADRIHDLGGSDQVVDEVATAAAYAMWCLPAPSGNDRTGFSLPL